MENNFIGDYSFLDVAIVCKLASEFNYFDVNVIRRNV